MALQGYIADVTKVQELGNLPSVKAEILEPFFPQARKEMKKYIGADLYALFASDNEWDEDADYNGDDTELIKAAEAYLVLCYAVGPLNVNSSGAGFTKSQGFGDGKKEILSENDIKGLEDRYRGFAEEILEDYIPALDADEDDNPDRLITGGFKMAAI